MCSSGLGLDLKDRLARGYTATTQKNISAATMTHRQSSLELCSWQGRTTRGGVGVGWGWGGGWGDSSAAARTGPDTHASPQKAPQRLPPSATTSGFTHIRTHACRTNAPTRASSPRHAAPPRAVHVPAPRQTGAEPTAAACPPTPAPPTAAGAPWRSVQWTRWPAAPPAPQWW
jgi:hypothetical protein